MRCFNPRTVGFLADGKTLTWSQKNYSKEFPTFPFPCGKCIECRAEMGSTKAVRCVHEAMLHDENCFVTLTYDSRYLTSPRLQIEHIQKFIKRLRARYNREIGVVWTGEYGDEKKRPHWHLLLFNWSPPSPEFLYTSDLGDNVFTSKMLGFRNQEEIDEYQKNTKHKSFKKMLWKYGKAEFGALTYKSASYVCRYALKKLIHGFDQDHDYHPIHNFRNRNAIGKKWLEKYWREMLAVGAVVLPDGAGQHSIPRYYLDWLKREQPEAFMNYVTGTKANRTSALALKEEEEKRRHYSNPEWSLPRCEALPFEKSRYFTKKTIAIERTERLQSFLKKGDI